MSPTLRTSEPPTEAPLDEKTPMTIWIRWAVYVSNLSDIFSESSLTKPKEERCTQPRFPSYCDSSLEACADDEGPTPGVSVRCGGFSRRGARHRLRRAFDRGKLSNTVYDYFLRL